MLRTALVVLLVAGVASAEDSPLVALAKRTNRKASKTPVITNETVAASKGRLSMAAGDTTASTGTQETSAAVVAGPVSPARLAPQAKADAQPQAPAPAAAAVVDPYRTPTNPASTVRNIEPQSSARNTDPQVTARTIDPSAAPVNANPQSTARTIAPESTARNIQPQQTTSKPPQQ
ncbi:MAG TPA: hypothetical protein VHL59_18450 [Thermoanaerobaculia bacterium]|nr:hypothetical protein [Thermoanaerobaculia bacterium]